jgi:SAM-dependent methyltransferase
MSWFEEWFDSPLYELLYAYRNEEEARRLANLIEEKIPPGDFSDVVDVGCGRGRHSIALAERGYHVTGLDLSPTAIEKARQIAEERDLSNVRFIVQDMRQPLDDTFDAAFNLFTTFGYFLEDSENERVLKSVNSMLKPKGLFLVDYLNATKVENELVPESEGSHDGIDYSIRKEIKNGCVYKNIRFSGEKIGSEKEYNERVKLYGREWFEESLKRTGYSVKKVWGNYDGDPFNESSSPRLIVVAEKKQD